MITAQVELKLMACTFFVATSLDCCQAAAHSLGQQEVVHVRSSSSMTVKMLAPWTCKHIFHFLRHLSSSSKLLHKKIRSCRLEQRQDKWQTKMFTCRTIVGIAPDNVTISIFSGSLKRWQEKPGSVFTTLDGVRENKHSLTRSTITVENVRKHQLQPITPPTCNIAALADKGSCCKLVQDKVTTTANECLPVGGVSTIGTALVSASLVLFRVIMRYCWTLIWSWLECYH